MSRIAFMLLLAFAAITGTAHAGGWATVELGEPVPGSLSAGEPWRVELIVKQHGVTPMSGVKPSVEITDDAGATQTFPARPTGTVGTYVAEVTYPTSGTWRTRFYDGFTDVIPHRLKPLEVAPATASASAGGDFPWHQTIAILVVALLWIGGWIAGYGWPHPHRPRAGAFGLRGRAA